MLKFTLFGMRVEINFLFVAVVTIFLLQDKSGVAVICLVACLMHEIGHIVAFLGCGYVPSLLAFEVNGIRLQEPICSIKQNSELVILLSGSFVNLSVFLGAFFSSGSFLNLGFIGTAHLFLGIFNLLPLKGFDGGRILSNLLIRGLSDKLTYKICTFVDVLFTILMLSLCVFLIAISKKNFTLIVMTCYLLFSSVTKVRKSIFS